MLSKDKARAKGEVARFTCRNCAADLYYDIQQGLLRCDFCGYQEDFTEEVLPCPSCGADLFYDVELGAMRCQFCGHREEFRKKSASIPKISYQEFLTTQKNQTGNFLEDGCEVSCPDCGASVISASESLATRCAFCGAPLLSQPKYADRIVPPHGICNFSIGPEQAQEIIRNWAKSLIMIPGDLRRAFAAEKTIGVYLPFWIFEADTKSRYRGLSWSPPGEITQLFAGREDRLNEVVCDGFYEKKLNNTPVLASDSIKSNVFDKETFCCLEQIRLEPFQPAFLAGFNAHRYQIDPVTGFELSKEKMQQAIIADLKEKEVDFRIKKFETKTEYANVNFSHVLLPFYLSSFKYQGEVYQVVINGGTGALEGDYPRAQWKLKMFKALRKGIALGILLALLFIIITLTYDQDLGFLLFRFLGLYTISIIVGYIFAYTLAVLR